MIRNDVLEAVTCAFLNVLGASSNSVRVMATSPKWSAL